MAQIRPARITSLDGWFEAYSQSHPLMEFAALGICLFLAWGLARLMRRAAGQEADRKSILFGERLVDGVLFPLLLLCLAYVAQAILLNWIPLLVFKIALPILVSLAAIRLGVKVLQAAFSDASWVRLMERSISWVAWIAVVLWISGLLPLMLDELDQITWKVGAAKLSVRNIIEGALTAGVVLILTLWVSSAIESRLLSSATGGQLSLRKAISNATRALLVFVGLLVALSVLGGAVGVGIGFGLQKLAANYVSGFVILAERSMRIGDNVRVDGFEGRISNINARYTQIRSVTGRESIVPNEMMITSRVENLSLADSKVWQSTVVSVAYDSDVELVMRLLREAAVQQPRVLTQPEASVSLSAFGADGLEFTVGYWVADPENGQLNLRSQINLAILRSLRENKIDIPYPQRVLHVRPGTGVPQSGAVAARPGSELNDSVSPPSAPPPSYAVPAAD